MHRTCRRHNRASITVHRCNGTLRGMEEQRPIESQLGRIPTSSRSTESRESLGLALSLSLNVVFDPLRRETVRDLDGRILETVRGDTCKSPPYSAVQSQFDGANYI